MGEHMLETRLGRIVVCVGLVGGVASGCVADDEQLSEQEGAVLTRCPGPSVAFKANPQPNECQSPTLAGVFAFDFNFSADDVAAGNTRVYFFDASNAEFVNVPPPTLSGANSFHTQWDATRITRAYYANAAGGTEDFIVPAVMVGAHHASTNNADPSANWRAGQNKTESIAISRMHTCTYLRTR